MPNDINAITSDPLIMSGQPCFSGTHITVELILRKLGTGRSVAELVDAYPQLTEATVLAALTFAANYMQHETVAGFTRSKMRHEDFVGLMVAASVGLQVAYLDVVAQWRPDEPPITILFGAFGDRIADDFDSYGVDTNREIFSLIEKAMESGDLLLTTAVATGLVEALVGRAERYEGLWSRVVPFLGPGSLYHAEAWLNWGNSGSTPVR
jgi:uncharacterized protein (DUF433 family)